jgi:arylsulfatase A-like enzyme
MADDLGYGDLSSYGNQQINTPHIDQLAKEGIRFTDFHSNGPVCSPTRAALLTGKYQQRTGVEGVITAKKHREHGLGLKEITIAEEFKNHGYHCGMYGKWHLGYTQAFNPIHQGFDEYTGFVSGNIDYHSHIDQEGFKDWWKGKVLYNEAGYATDLITKYGVDFIVKNNPKETDKPFLLYLPHAAPHYPYQRQKSNSFREVGKRRVYNAKKDSIPSVYKEMVEVMDNGVGEIVQTLKATGQYENTIFVFLSDNGASSNGNNGNLRGFKGSPYEGGSRVPAIISYPDKIKKGQVNEQTVLTMDLLPTLLDFIGRKPSCKNIDGISVKDNLLHQVDLPERDLFFAFKDKSFVRSGQWKLIRSGNKDEAKIELFDLSNDLQESHDVSANHSVLVDKLMEKLNAWEKEVRVGVK